MKKISNNLWTDGEHNYSGNPREGFKKLNQERAQEIVEAVKNREKSEIVEAQAFELKQPKEVNPLLKVVDTDSEK